MPRSNLIQWRLGTAAQWTATNPVLAMGEPGLETDTAKTKLGNGVTAWTGLAYQVTAADIATAVAATDWTLPASAKAHTFPRTTPTINAAALVSGGLYMVGIPLLAGQVISTITFYSSTTALASGTNQWFALYSGARALLGVTNDDTSTAWAAETAKTLTLAAPYTVLTSGMYYVGALTVATTAPSLRCAVTSLRINLAAPIPAGASTTALTNPASAPATAGAIAASGLIPYAEVS